MAIVVVPFPNLVVVVLVVIVVVVVIYAFVVVFFLLSQIDLASSFAFAVSAALKKSRNKSKCISHRNRPVGLHVENRNPSIS